jgi:hypothetical protein
MSSVLLRSSMQANVNITFMNNAIVLWRVA